MAMINRDRKTAQAEAAMPGDKPTATRWKIFTLALVIITVNTIA